MLLYKFRNLIAVLKCFREIEKREIYFASYDELNDPFEGLEDIFWHGDKVMWRNLLRHFLMCLDSRFYVAQRYPQERAKEFYSKKIGVFGNEEQRFKTENDKRRFADIKRRFYSEESTQKAIEYLSNRQTPMRREFLVYVLHLILPHALRCIVSVDIERGVSQLAELHDNLSSFIDGSENRASVAQVFESLGKYHKADNGESMDDFLAISYFNAEIGMSLAVQLSTGQYHRQDIDLPYFTIDFPQEYVSELAELIHNRCYSASFVPSPEQTVMWSHYADYHRGVCLIFKTKMNDWKDPKRTILGLSAPAFIEPIDYSGKPVVFDFFRSLYRYNWKDLESLWYIDDEGNRSETAPTYEDLTTERDNHLDKTVTLYRTKKKDWIHEGELRAILYDTLEQYSEPQSRCIKYDFDSLEGIIFGIKTPMEAKLEIIYRVYEHCQKTERTDFKFYQARYDRQGDKIVPMELQQLQFSFHNRSAGADTE